MSRIVWVKLVLWNALFPLPGFPSPPLIHYNSLLRFSIGLEIGSLLKKKKTQPKKQAYVAWELQLVLALLINSPSEKGKLHQ